MQKNTKSVWTNISLYMFLGLLAYMPLHILLSTWFGTSFGVLSFVKIAKEIVLLIGASTALAVVIRTGVVRQLLHDKLIWAITAFALLNIGLAVFRSTDLDAKLLGLIYNVRFLVFFVWAMILSRLFETKSLVTHAVKVVLISGMLTVVFGLMQFIVLPDNALSHVGYTRENGVLPAFFIDDKPDLERIMSTVRDPNSYGSYLIIIISLLASISLFGKKQKLTKKNSSSIIYHQSSVKYFLPPAFIALFWTFSRSAWIGTFVATVVIMVFFLHKHRTTILRYKRYIAISVLSLGVITTGLLTVSWHSYWVQNVVFHADKATVLEDPNQLRVRFWHESINNIKAEPLGSGPGTAGLASIRNDKRTILNENYYLQVAQENGIIGLLLFISILVMIAIRLYREAIDENDWLAVALLASLAGLMLTNFLVHIWANEAVAYTWWGLAGLAFSSKDFPKLA